MREPETVSERVRRRRMKKKKKKKKREVCGYKRKREEQKRDATVEEGMQGGKRWSEGLKGHKG